MSGFATPLTSAKQGHFRIYSYCPRSASKHRQGQNVFKTGNGLQG